VYFNTGYGYKIPSENEIGIKDKLLANNTSDNAFLTLFLQSTLMTLYQNVFLIENDLFRNKIIYAFSEIPKIAKWKKSKFVFLHLISPHYPYLFKIDGTKQNQIPNNIKDEKKQYLEQLIFLNSKVKETIINILKYSNKPPIIIIQSDHGSAFNHEIVPSDLEGLKERFYILNSIYAPDNIRNKFKSGITPVNSFRIILNELFKTNLTILEDKSFIPTQNPPYEYLNVSDLIK
jgi:hypothetical protein